MIKNYYYLKTAFLLLFAVSVSNVNAQCSLTGIDPEYCADASGITMIGSPAGGVFSGAGVTGDTFDPATAGPGLHTISYSYTGGNKYYVKSFIGNPWGVVVNNDAMNLAFGSGNWMLESFESMNVAAVFAPSTSFVFIDGSDDQASELQAFLLANITTIENWVAAGGSLLMNSAPNEGGNIDFGFGSTTLSYGFYAGSVTVQDLLHPAYVGPNSPTASVMTGGSYGHAQIIGGGYSNLLTESSTGEVILCEKPWGSGRVMMGGMTTNNFHSPLTESANWRANLLVYMESMTMNPSSCVATFDVTVNELPVIDAAVSIDEQLGTDGGVDLTVSGGAPAYTFDWDNDGTGDFDDAEDLSGVVAGTYIVTIIDQNGCSTSQSVVVGSQVGVEELTNVELSVSPNPATEMVTITLNGSFEFELTDLNGSIMFEGKSKNTKDLNISSLASGVYLLTIEQDDKMKTVRVVKQ